MIGGRRGTGGSGPGLLIPREAPLRAVLAAFPIILLLLGIPRATAGDEPLRFDWARGDVFIYRMDAEVRRGSMKATVEGRFRLRAVGPGAALLDREVASIDRDAPDEGDRREDGAGTGEAPQLLLPMDPAGRVPDGTGIGEEEARAVEGFIAALFPMPPGGVVPPGGAWDLAIAQEGDRFSGEARLAGEEDRFGQRCRLIVFEGASGETGREISGRAYFAPTLGAFVAVDREVRDPGPPERIETMTLRLRRHPSGPVLDPDYRKRLRLARESVDRDPGDPAAHARLAGVFREGGALSHALEAIRTAIEIDPDAVRYREEEGVILGLLGRVPEARAVLEDVIGSGGAGERARIHLARILYQDGDLDLAARQVEAVLDHHPSSADARFLLGVIRGKQGRIEEARDLVRSAIPSVDGTSPPVVTFDSDGDLRLVMPRPAPAGPEARPLSAEERLAAREIVEVFVGEEAARSSLGEVEVRRVLEYMAAAVGQEVEEMIAEVLRDRQGTADRISEALALRSVISLDEVRSIAASAAPELRLGAAFYLPLEEAVPIVEARIEESPARPSLYIHLASIILRGDPDLRSRRDLLLRTCRTARDLDGTNGLPGLIAAAALFGEGKPGPALQEFTAAIERPEIRTRRVEEARLRRKVLVEVDFDPVFRGAAAWMEARAPFPRPVRIAVEAMAALARARHEQGAEADARAYLDALLVLAARLREGASDVALIEQAAAIEGIAIQTRLGLWESPAGAEEALQEWRRSVEAEREAIEEFRAERDRALRLWPITRPAAARDYLRALHAGERAVLDEYIRRSPSPEEGDR